MFDTIRQLLGRKSSNIDEYIHEFIVVGDEMFFGGPCLELHRQDLRAVPALQRGSVLGALQR